MTDRPEQSSTEGMKAKGYYDAHSEYQRRVIEAADGLIRSTVDGIDPLPTGALTIADYGCGTGATSVHAVSTALAALRKRAADLPVRVIHNDVPTNDFTQLFHNVAGDAGYLSTPGGPIYPTAAAGSFFTQVVPDGAVNFGMCSNAAHWFREQPNLHVPEGMFHSDASGEARESLAKQAADDWLAFLTNRAAELAPGGRLLVQGIGTVDDRHVSASKLLTQMWRTAMTLVDNGRLERSRLDDYVFPVYCRSIDEVKAPLGEWFDIVSATVDEVANPYWEQLERSGDAGTYADNYVAFVRAFAESTMLAHLFRPSTASANEAAALSDEYFRQLRDDTERDPEAGRYEAWIVRLVVTK